MANEAGAIRAGRAYIELFTSDKALKAGLAGAEKSLATFGKSVKAVGAGLQDLGTKMATFGVGAAAGIMTASKSFGDYEQSLASLRANTGMTADKMKEVDKAAQGLSESMGQGPTAIMKGMDELAKSKSGITVKNGLVEITQAAVELAKVSGLEVPEAMNAITNAMNIFGGSAGDAADTISRAADASSISIQDALLSFSQSGAVAKLVGGEMKDLASAVALLGNEGVKGSDAGTSLKTMLVSLIKPTDTGKKVIKQYGLNFRDAAGKLLDFEGIAGELHRGLGKLNDEAQQQALAELFGSDALRAGAIIMEKGAAGIREFRKGMADSLGVSQKYAILMDTLNGKMEALWAGVERASIAIGGVFNASLTRMIAIVAGTVKGIAELVATNRDFVAGFAKTIAIVTAAGVAMAALGVAIGLVTSPLGLVAVGLGGATAALVKFTSITRDFETAWTAIGDSLAKGDLAGAAKLGMLELQIVYQSGTLAILKIWDDWGNAMIDVFRDMAATMHRIMGEMGSTLVEFATLIASGTNTPVRVAFIQNIEQQRQQLMDQINAAQEAEKARRRGRSEGDIKDRERALQKARDELAALAQEAKRPPSPTPGELVGPPKPDAAKAAQEVGKGLEAALDKVDVKGTFSAIGAQRALGAGDTVADKLDEQIALQEKELKELVRLNRKATPLVFSS